MTPSRWLALAAGGLLLLAATFRLWPRGPSRAGAPSWPPAAKPRTGPAGGAGLAGGALREAVVQSGAPGSTPGLADPAGAEDGFVEVRVLAQGRPRAGAHVRLYLRGRADPDTGQIDWRFAGAADSDATGLARIAARPGVYLLAARSETFAPARLEFRREAGKRATQVAVELRPAVVVSGRAIEEASQKPVPLALVTLTWQTSARPAAPAEEQARATSDALGRFRIEGLAPGSYRATAHAAGLGRTVARVEAYASREITVELLAASFLEGRVLAGDGATAAGARVVAITSDAAVHATAGEGGRFSLEAAAGEWSVTARQAEQAGRAPPVAVAAGAIASDVIVRLGPSSSILGAVLAAATGWPVAAAQIAVRPQGASSELGSAESAPNGAFEVAALPPGSYDVEVSAGGFAAEVRRAVALRAGEKSTLRLALRRTGDLEGAVLDKAGRPVGFARVRADPALPEARSDAAGNYRLSGLAPGAGIFTALRAGSALGAVQSARVPEGGVARLDFTLEDEGVLTGRVRRPDGAPAPAGARVLAIPLRSGPEAPGAVLPLDALGVYLAALPAGRYRVELEGGGAPAAPVTVAAGKTTAHDLAWTGDALRNARAP